jgi:lysosome membrane protein 2
MNYTMNTAYSDIYSIGKIKKFNDLSVLNIYTDPYANIINGTDGTLYPPGRTRNQTVYAFSPDMCR